MSGRLDHFKPRYLLPVPCFKIGHGNYCEPSLREVYLVICARPACGASVYWAGDRHQKMEWTEDGWLRIWRTKSNLAKVKFPGSILQSTGGGYQTLT